jgi:ERCC4-type nuclease
MKIIIDERERDLYDKCLSIIQENVKVEFQLSKEVLPLGDIFIKTPNDNSLILIERKSLSDLLASIKDGRYEEQSYRLIHSSGIPRHSIIYIIEGSLSQLRNSTEKKIVYSSITSLNVFKGFTVLRTNNVSETAEYILNMANKLSRNILKNVFPYYSQLQNFNNVNENIMNNDENNNIVDGEQPIITNQMTTIEPTVADYCSVVKKVKKDNVTPENIGEIILCQIPSISAVTAISVMKRFSTFPNLMKELQTNIDCLDNITFDTNGKTRKISKTCVENIKKYLL